MSMIKMSPEELIDSSKKYAEGSQGVDDILKKLDNEQQLIVENWQGEASRSFDEQFRELSGKVREFSQLLLDIQRQLEEVADTIIKTDDEIASKIRG